MLPPLFFRDLTKAHADRNPLDITPPKGFQRVRVDGGNSHTMRPHRIYSIIRAGYGEGRRAENARRRYDRECIWEARGN
jgi:hypothetical protein